MKRVLFVLLFLLLSAFSTNQAQAQCLSLTGELTDNFSVQIESMKKEVADIVLVGTLRGEDKKSFLDMTGGGDFNEPSDRLEFWYSKEYGNVLLIAAKDDCIVISAVMPLFYFQLYLQMSTGSGISEAILLETQ